MAIIIVSESEIKVCIPHFSKDYSELYPTEFKSILWNLGCNTNSSIEQQDDVLHRNRLNQEVLCTRWVALERIDDAWLKSGYASREVLNEQSGSKMVKEVNPHLYDNNPL